MLYFIMGVAFFMEILEDNEMLMPVLPFKILRQREFINMHEGHQSVYMHSYVSNDKINDKMSKQYSLGL